MTGRLDVSEAEALAREFHAAPAAMQRMAVGAADRQGKAMVDDARQRIGGHPKARHYPAAIMYEVSVSAAGVNVDLGVDKGKTQGPLWNILEFGTSKNAPIPHLGPAADAASGPFETALGVIAERLP